MQSLEECLEGIKRNLRQIEEIDRLKIAHGSGEHVMLLEEGAPVDDVKRHLEERRRPLETDIECSISQCLDAIAHLDDDWHRSDDPKRLGACVEVLRVLEDSGCPRSLLARGVLRAIWGREMMFQGGA